MMENPTTVRRAFAGESEHELTLEAVLILESLGCRYLTGGTPGLRDAVLCYLAITNLHELKRARKSGSIEDLVEAWSRHKRPADLLALQPEIERAVQAAFAPVQTGAGEAEPDHDDPLKSLQKKAPESAGGSPSSTPSPGNTTGPSTTS